MLDHVVADAMTKTQGRDVIMCTGVSNRATGIGWRDYGRKTAEGSGVVRRCFCVIWSKVGG